jgi:hypothetical protein
MRIAPILLVLLTGAALAQGQGATMTWKWREAGGQIVVSDRPPPSNVAEKDILQTPQTPRRPAPAAPSASASGPGAAGTGRPVATAGVDPELEARRKRLADEQQAQNNAQQKAQEEKDSAVRAENCARARGHLAALSDGQRLTRTNAQGEREVLDDKQRAEEMQRARAIIASDCR